MDAQKLYQDLVLRWNADRRFSGEITDATHRAEGCNPLCGDQVLVSLRMADDVITAAKFKGEMSAITTASAAILCHQVSGLTAPDARQLALDALQFMQDGTVHDVAKLGEFAAFEVVRRYPNRIKTATLPWAALLAALDNPIERAHAMPQTTTEQEPMLQAASQIIEPDIAP